MKPVNMGRGKVRPNVVKNSIKIVIKKIEDIKDYQKFNKNRECRKMLFPNRELIT